MANWKVSAFGPKLVIRGALLAHEEAEDWDWDIVLTGSEVAEDRPNDWVLQAYLPRRPSSGDKAAIAAWFEDQAPEFQIQQLPDADWVSESQKGVDPIRAGKFFVHTPEFAPSAEPSITSFIIPASQAFGTGQHATTAGCLRMLTAMQQRGMIPRAVADIGTGTGLLAFAALDLWPAALATASDIDPVCVGVVEENAAQNGVRLGSGRGALTMVIADGMDDPLLQARGPYDLLIANILAGPLVELAPDFSQAVPSGGNLLLAGLLETQEQTVRRAYRREGFRLAARLVNGDWSILWLRKRAGK